MRILELYNQICSKFDYTIFIEIVLILIGTFLVNRFIKRCFSKLIKNAIDQYYSALYQAILSPLKLALWLLSITFILDIINHQFQINILKFNTNIRIVGMIILITWVLLRVITFYEKRFIKSQHVHSNIDKYTIDVTSKILKSSLMLISGLIILESLGFSISGIIAVGGIGGAAIAFASQNMLANFFGTLMLYLDKPFAVGESIFILEEKIRGKVESIGWRVTAITTPEQTSLYIPNALFAKGAIINSSRNSNKGKKRIFEKIGIEPTRSSIMIDMINQIHGMLANSSVINTTKKIEVTFSNFGPNYIELSIEAFTNLTDDREFKEMRQEFMLSILDLAISNDVKIIYSNENKPTY